MCGIVGYIKLNKENKKRFTPELITMALEECSTRGGQATGFYSTTTGTVKDGEHARRFIKEHTKEITKALESDIFIAHTRAATTGWYNNPAPASDNDNNHPHEGKRFVLVHNGHFGHLPLIKGYDYKGHCDSELALSYVETFGIEKGISLMSKSDGFSLVIFDKKLNNVYFYRESNPLVFAFDFRTEAVIFGSTTAIAISLVPELGIRGLPLCTSTCFYDTKANSLYTFSGGNLKEVKEVKLRLSDSALNDLPETIKDKMELTDFFASVEKQWERFQRKDSRFETSRYSSGNLGRNSIQQNTAKRTYSQSLPPMVFTVLKEGTIRFFQPLVIAGDTTNFG